MTIPIMMRRLSFICFFLLLSGLTNELSAQKLANKVADQLCDCFTQTYAQNDEADLDIVQVLGVCVKQVLEANEKKLAKEIDMTDSEAGRAFGEQLMLIAMEKCPNLKERIENAKEQGTLSPLESNLKKGDDLYEEGDYEAAAEAYWQAHLADPENSRALNDLGYAIWPWASIAMRWRH